MREQATVYLVGAGPGDPELLTVKAVRVLEQADVVVYDRLVSTDVMDLVPQGTARIYVGKAASNHHMAQEDINGLLVKLAQNNRNVVRLKGGDPFIFGRGSEEAVHLAQNGIPFEVIPGITAASGISASLGVPLTHRGMATGVRFVTGHSRAGHELDLDWKSLADGQTTLVFYMGLANLSFIAERLVAEGLSPNTPAAAISKGTVEGQRQCVSTLTGLADEVAKLDLPSPALFVVGEVVSLAGVLNWQGLLYENASDEFEEQEVATISAHA